MPTAKCFPSYSRFIVTWETSSSCRQVGRRLRRLGYAEMSTHEVRFWAQLMRTQGVHLKRMPATKARWSRLVTRELVSTR